MILSSDNKRFLFVRPRRFGKSVNLTMLKEFFEPNEKTEHKSNHYFSDSAFSQYRGQHPLIYLNFSSVKGEDYAGFLLRMKDVMLRYLNDRELKYPDLKAREEKGLHLQPICFSTSKEEELEVAIETFPLKLAINLHRITKKTVAILIDEYDTPLWHAFFEKDNFSLYQKMVDRFSKMFENILKPDGILPPSIVVITGILKISKSGIFSGPNNIFARTILENKFSSYFGFTQDEVYKAFNYYNLKPDFSLISRHYGGYNIGTGLTKTTMYNPHAIMNLITKYKENGVTSTFDSYWSTTGDEKIIVRLLEKMKTSQPLEFYKFFSCIENLFNNKYIISSDKKADISFNELNQCCKSADALIQLMYLTGYLTHIPYEDKESLAGDADFTRSLRFIIPNLDAMQAIYKIVSYFKIQYRLVAAVDIEKIKTLEEIQVQRKENGEKTTCEITFLTSSEGSIASVLIDPVEFNELAAMLKEKKPNSKIEDRAQELVNSVLKKNGGIFIPAFSEEKERELMRAFQPREGLIMLLPAFKLSHQALLKDLDEEKEKILRIFVHFFHINKNAITITKNWHNIFSNEDRGKSPKSLMSFFDRFHSLSEEKGAISRSDDLFFSFPKLILDRLCHDGLVSFYIRLREHSILGILSKGNRDTFENISKSFCEQFADAKKDALILYQAEDFNCISKILKDIFQFNPRDSDKFISIRHYLPFVGGFLSYMRTRNFSCVHLPEIYTHFFSSKEFFSLDYPKLPDEIARCIAELGNEISEDLRIRLCFLRIKTLYCLKRLTEYEHSISEIKSIIEHKATPGKRPYFLSEFYYRKAECYFDKYDNQNALLCYQKVKKIMTGFSPAPLHVELAELKECLIHLKKGTKEEIDTFNNKIQQIKKTADEDSILYLRARLIQLRGLLDRSQEDPLFEQDFPAIKSQLITFYGTSSFILLNFLVNVGSYFLHFSKGKENEAIEYLEKADKILIQLLPEEKDRSRHPITFLLKFLMAGINQAKGEYNLALENFGQVLKYYELKDGRDTLKTAVIYNNMGEMWKNIGNPIKAVEEYKQCFKIIQELEFNEVKNTLPSQIIVKQPEIKEELKIIGVNKKEEKELSADNKLAEDPKKWEENPDILLLKGMYYNNSAEVLLIENKDEDALNLLEKAADLFSKLKERGIWGIVEVNCNRAEVCRRKQQFAEALDYLKMMAIEYIDIYIPNALVVKYYHTLGSIYWGLGNLNASLDAYKRADKIISDKFSPVLKEFNKLKIKSVELALGLIPGNKYIKQLSGAIDSWRYRGRGLLPPPIVEDYRLKIITTYLSDGLLAEAIADLNQYFPLKKENELATGKMKYQWVRAFYLHGRITFLRKKYSEALDFYERALTLWSNSWAGAERGTLLSELRFEAARTCYILKNRKAVEYYSQYSAAFEYGSKGEPIVEILDQHFGQFTTIQGLENMKKGEVHLDEKTRHLVKSSIKGLELIDQLWEEEAIKWKIFGHLAGLYWLTGENDRSKGYVQKMIYYAKKNHGENQYRDQPVDLDPLILAYLSGINLQNILTYFRKKHPISSEDETKKALQFVNYNESLYLVGLKEWKRPEIVVSEQQDQALVRDKVFRERHNFACLQHISAYQMARRSRPRRAEAALNYANALLWQNARKGKSISLVELAHILFVHRQGCDLDKTYAASPQVFYEKEIREGYYDPLITVEECLKEYLKQEIDAPQKKSIDWLAYSKLERNSTARAVRWLLRHLDRIFIDSKALSYYLLCKVYKEQETEAADDKAKATFERFRVYCQTGNSWVNQYLLIFAYIELGLYQKEEEALEFFKLHNPKGTPHKIIQACFEDLHKQLIFQIRKEKMAKETVLGKSRNGSELKPVGKEISGDVIIIQDYFDILRSLKFIPYFYLNEFCCHIRLEDGTSPVSHINFLNREILFYAKAAIEFSIWFNEETCQVRFLLRRIGLTHSRAILANCLTEIFYRLRELETQQIIHSLTQTREGIELKVKNVTGIHTVINQIVFQKTSSLSSGSDLAFTFYGSSRKFAVRYADVSPKAQPQEDKHLDSFLSTAGISLKCFLSSKRAEADLKEFIKQEGSNGSPSSGDILSEVKPILSTSLPPLNAVENVISPAPHCRIS